MDSNAFNSTASNTEQLTFHHLTVADRERLERELARARRRLKRVVWSAVAVVALLLAVLCAGIMA